MDSVNYLTPVADGATLLREVTRLYVRAQRETVACCGAQTAARCHVLGELARSGPLRLTELARHLDADKSWVSRAVASLTAERLLACVGSEGDGRVVNVELTKAGRAAWKELDAALRRHARATLERLPPADQELVERALLLLRQVLDGGSGERIVRDSRPSRRRSAAKSRRDT